MTVPVRQQSYRTWLHDPHATTLILRHGSPVELARLIDEAQADGWHVVNLAGTPGDEWHDPKLVVRLTRPEVQP